MESAILYGWKEIEAYLGIKRDAILRQGYPVRQTGKKVMAVKEDLLHFARTFPLCFQKT